MLALRGLEKVGEELPLGREEAERAVPGGITPRTHLLRPSRKFHALPSQANRLFEFLIDVRAFLMQSSLDEPSLADWRAVPH